jgi:Helix-turn-helix domain
MKIKEPQIKPRLKIYLLSGKTVTVLQALKMWGTTELRVYVTRLKKDGYNVKKKMIKSKRTRKIFAQYYIPI